MKTVTVFLLAATLTACSAGGTGQHTLASRVELGDHSGTLTEEDRSTATAAARREQGEVTRTFVGATAFLTRGTPFDRDSGCDQSSRYLTIRLVWGADASFTHGQLSSTPPDGPRKELLMTVDQATQALCETAAAYRNVGAKDGETLLYGEWPSPSDG